MNELAEKLALAVHRKGVGMMEDRITHLEEENLRLLQRNLLLERYVQNSRRIQLLEEEQKEILFEMEMEP